MMHQQERRMQVTVPDKTLLKQHDCSINEPVLNKSLSVSCVPIMLNKDIIPSIENLCPHHNGVDIRNGGEFFAEPQQHGDSLQLRGDSHSKQCYIATLLKSESLYSKSLANMTELPSHIHVYKTKSKTSSQRTQLGSIAHIAEAKKMSFRQKINHNMKHNKKLQRINDKFIQVDVPSSIMENVLIEKEIKDQYIVFDGGDKLNPKIKCPKDLNKTWRRIRVLDCTGLHVVMSNDNEKGLSHRAENGTPNFMLLSRKKSMAILPKKGLAGLSSAISTCEKAKGSALTHRKSKMTFGDDVYQPPKYTSVGVQPNRAKSGVSPIVPFMKKTGDDYWDWLMRMMRWSERAFEMMAPHSALHHIRTTKEVISFPTMCQSSSDEKQTSAKYYGAIAFGRNVHLRCHTDQDYMMSVIQIHLDGRDSYSIDEKVVAYFCFPTLGIAVALRPGDFLLFNPTVPLIFTVSEH